MSKRISSVVGLALSVVMLLSACSGGTSPSPTGSTQASPTVSASTSASTSPSATPSATNTATEGEKLAQNQVFTFAVINDPDGLDPGITSNSFAAPFLYNLFEGLTRYDVENNLVPGVAESWDVNEDGTVYTFHLRPNLKWSNGMDLTAHDFVYAWQRVVNPDTGSSGPNTIYDYVKNGYDVFTGKMEPDELGAKALDDSTLEVTLENPTGFFLQLLAGWRYYPVCKAIVEQSENPEDWTRSKETYVGNGPFRYVDYKLSDNFVIEKNENYWNAEAVSLEKIDFKFIPELATALAAYEKGEVDGVLRVPSTEVPRLKARDDFYAIDQFSHTYYLINTTSPALEDPRVRWALAYGVDRQALIEDVLNASYEPASGLIPPGYIVDGVDFREEIGNYGISDTPEIEKAKALLAEAGYPNGEGFPKLRLGYYTNETAKKIAEALQQMYKQNLNIEFEIVSAEWAVFFEQVHVLDYDICAMGESGGYLHPMTFFTSFAGDNPQLTTGWNSKEFNDLYKAVMAETDPDKSWQMLKDLEQIYMDGMPILPLYHGKMYMMMGDHVKNWNFTPLAVYVFDKIYITEK